MTKKEKAIIALMIPVAIICLVLYVLITEYSAQQKSLLVYPEGTLSDSLFVSQNNSYTKNDSLPNSHAFLTVPYYIDVMAGSEANVGRGSIIQAAEDIFIYLSEYNPVTDNAESIMLEEFPSALLIDYNPLYTYSQKLETQTGYINGFAANYLFNMITVSNGEISRTAYVAAYDMVSIDHVEDDSYPRIMVAVVTTSANSQSFAVCKNVLDAMALTIRYDEKLAKKIDSEKEKEAVEAESTKEDSKEESTEGSSKEPDSDIPPHEREAEEYNYDFTDLIEDNDVDPRFVPLIVDEEYEDMYILVTTDIFVKDSVMTLYSADRKILGVNSVSEDGLINTLHAGKVTKEEYGLFVIKVTQFGEYGSMQVDIEDRGAEE